MKFFKVHGLGNDFILIDARRLEKHDWCEFSKLYCERRVGVGADGVLLVLDSDIADTRMRIFNADGSEAEMCGNGIRCFSRYVYEQGIVKSTSFCVETLSGIVKPQVFLDADGSFTGVKVDMGEPIFECRDIPVTGEGLCMDRPIIIDDREYRFSSVLVGVPHTYIFVDRLEDVDIAKVGALIECAEEFPKHTNVNFVRVIDDSNIEMRTFERGCGCTLACGTGASGAVAACHLNGKTGKNITVSLEKGQLNIEWADNNHIYMSGSATTVYEGEIK